MRVLVTPSTVEGPLADALVLAGVEVLEPDDDSSPDLGIVDLSTEPASAVRSARDLVAQGVPVLVVLPPDRLPLIESEPWWEDFATTPIDAVELRTRMRRMVAGNQDEDRLVYEDLVLDTATYQAELAGGPVDLTYMEYELLKFFVQHRGRVWSREQLLSRVWGYEYFGGARTVDVHVRRLRAKLGEERAGWITTVRSVGYRFG
jgi:two-component system alkaline phosphatase synthesis response regulator PhoP